MEETPLLDGPSGSAALRGAGRTQTLVVVTQFGRCEVSLSPAQAAELHRAAPGRDAPLEIERRWLAEPPSDLDRYPSDRLRQAYLLTDPAGVLRVRERGGGHKVTLKWGSGVARREIEFEVSPEQVGLLWPLGGGREVDKTRYLLPDGDRPLELDVYHGAHDGLVVLEREFSSVEAASSYVPPAWALAEVTDDPRYTNARLAELALALAGEEHRSGTS